MAARTEGLGVLAVIGLLMVAAGALFICGGLLIAPRLISEGARSAGRHDPPATAR